MRTVSLALLASLSLFACSAPSSQSVDSDSASDETQDEGASALSNPNYGYFAAQRDMRKCASPMCGGYFIHRVNASKTRCIDGSYAATCYVTGVDLSKLNLTDGDLEVGHAVFRGSIEKTEINGKTWGLFAAGEAWVGQTASSPAGSFYRAKDNGIRCIKAPCPSISVDKLNTNAVRMISDLDLTGTANPATQKQIDAAMDDVFTSDDGLLVAGTIAAMKNGGHEIVATEFFRKTTGIRYCGSRGLAACNSGEYCAYPANANCGRADAGGTCTTKPQICIQIYKPVCGCNNKTYSNSCHAAGAGTSVDYAGACAN